MQIRGGALFVVVSCMGTALAMGFSGQGGTSSDVVDAVARERPSARPVAAPGNALSPELPFDLAAIKRRVPTKIKASGLFQSRSWIAPSPSQPISALAPPKQQTQPEPEMPTLPFTFMGRIIDGDEVLIFLSRNDREYVAKVHDVLDDSYRIDKITDSAAVFTYLPLNKQMTLDFHSTAVGSSGLNEATPEIENPLAASSVGQQPGNVLTAR